MANLFTGSIVGNNYIDLFNYADISPVENTAYQIQIQDSAYLREGTIGEGIIVNTPDTITFTYKGDTLYIKPLTFNCVVNIAN